MTQGGANSGRGAGSELPGGQQQDVPRPEDQQPEAQ